MGTGGLFLRKLRARVADEPTGFVWVERGRLAASGYPASRAQIGWVLKAGIRSILTLTEDPLPPQWVEGLDVVTEHVPMKDHEAPAPDSLDRGVGFLVGELAKGRPVMVHCLAGEGRTGCVLAAYLVRTRGVGPDEALATLRRVKAQFVEPGQERAVSDFAAQERGARKTT